MRPKDYDRIIQLAAPGYNDALKRIAQLIPLETRRVVSLGTGTGNLEQRIFERIPASRIIGYDTNCDFINLAREKLAAFNFTGYSGEEGDITKTLLPKAECMVSSLAIHHISDESKGRLFERISLSLARGGLFINYDIAKAENPEEHRSFVDYVTGFMRSNSLPESLISEEKEILNGIGDNADKPMLLDIQKNLLNELGLECKILWQDHLFVIYAAITL